MKHIYLFDINNIAGVYGIGTYIRELSQTIIADKQMHLTIVRLFCNKSEFSIEKKDGIRILSFPTPTYLQNFEDDKYALSICCILEKKINNKEQNIFHFNYLQHIHLIPLLRKQYPNAIMYFTIHYTKWCTLINCNVHKLQMIIQKKQNVIRDPIERSVYDEYIKTNKMCKFVNYIICLSNYTYYIMSEIYHISKDKLLLSHNRLKDEASFPNTLQKEELKKNMTLDKKEKIILYVGRISRHKGIDILLDTFAKVVNQYPNIRLLIAGDGDYNLILEKCFAFCSKVTLLGKISKEVLYKVYQIADIGIQPSINEQCSYVAIEMMMHGIPLIGLDSTGIGEMIENGYNGFKTSLHLNTEGLIDTDAVTNELSIRVLELLSNKKRHKMMRKYSREVFQKKYQSDIGEGIFLTY